MMDWLAAGTHRYLVESDQIYWESHGSVQAADARCLADCMIRITQHHPRAYVLVDARNQLPISPEGRKVYVDVLLHQKPRFALAAFGGSFGVRVAGQMVVRAARLIYGLDLAVLYTHTEDQARRFLAQERLRRGPPYAPQPR